MKMTRVVMISLVSLLAFGCKNDQPKEQPTSESVEVDAEAAPEKPVVAEPRKFGQAWADVDEAARTAAFGEPAKLRSLLSYELVRSATPEEKGAEIGPYGLVVANEKTKDLNREQDIGIRRARSVIVAQARVFEGQDLATLCKIDCQRAALNAAFATAAGGPIFNEDGSPSVEALKKLFSALYVQPDAKLLGLEAKELYAMMRPAARDVSGIYAGLNAIGLKEVEASFKNALEEHPEPESAVNRGLLKFYKRYTNLEGVADKGGIESESSHWTLVSFWIRRIDDGSAPVLASFMNKFFKDYDPEWHQKYFAGSGD